MPNVSMLFRICFHSSADISFRVPAVRDSFRILIKFSPFHFFTKTAAAPAWSCGSNEPFEKTIVRLEGDYCSKVAFAVILYLCERSAAGGSIFWEINAGG